MLRECPHCFTRMIPKVDGTCPACQKDTGDARGTDPTRTSLQVSQGTLPLRTNAYERFIQNTRICTAIGFAISGVGLFVCANLGIEPLAMVFAIAAVVFLTAVPILIVEQIVAAWVTAGRARISLAALLVITAVSGVLFAVMRNSVFLALLLLVAAVTIASVCLEGKRPPKRISTDNSGPPSRER